MAVISAKKGLLLLKEVMPGVTAGDGDAKAGRRTGGGGGGEMDGAGTGGVGLGAGEDVEGCGGSAGGGGGGGEAAAPLDAVPVVAAGPAPGTSTSDRARLSRRLCRRLFGAGGVVGSDGPSTCDVSSDLRGCITGVVTAAAAAPFFLRCGFEGAREAARAFCARRPREEGCEDVCDAAESTSVVDEGGRKGFVWVVEAERGVARPSLLPAGAGLA